MVLCADHNDPEVLRGVGIAPSQCAALVMTHDHQLDREVIGWALKQGFSLVGGVGSRAKMARTAKWLQTRGFTPEDVQRVRMPIGLDIGARLPPEIAVAIAAELVRWRADGRASKRRDEERSPRAREDETEASPLGAE